MTGRSDVRRRGTLALLVGTLLAGVVLLLTTGASRAGEPCNPLEDPECIVTTSSSETTTTAVETTTTVEETTTTDFVPQTTTTRRQTVATEPDAVETTTTIPVSTSLNVLVPGDGTEGAESTTTTVQTATKISSQDGNDRMLISLVIAGLLLLAVVVAILTWRYWVATRPPLVTG